MDRVWGSMWDWEHFKGQTGIWCSLTQSLTWNSMVSGFFGGHLCQNTEGNEIMGEPEGRLRGSTEK